MNWKKILLLFISAIVLVWVVQFSNPAEVWAKVKAIPKYYLAAFLLPTAVANSLRALRWRALIAPEKQLPFMEALHYQVAGLAMSNLTPARLGEAGKLLLLKRYAGLRLSKSLQSVIYERLFDLAVLLAISIPFFALLVGRLDPRLAWLSVLSVFFVAGICALVALAMASESAGMRLLRVVQKMPVVKKYITKEFMDSFYGTKKFSKRVFWMSALLTAIIWAVDGIAFLVIFSVLGISLPVHVIVGGMFLSVLIGLVSFLPGGIGSSEFSYIVILMILGISKSQAAAGVLVGRAFTLGFTLVWGMLALSYLMWKNG